MIRVVGIICCVGDKSILGLDSIPPVDLPRQALVWKLSAPWFEASEFAQAVHLTAFAITYYIETLGISRIRDSGAESNATPRQVSSSLSRGETSNPGCKWILMVCGFVRPNYCDAPLGHQHDTQILR